jgi:hypothetical protein
MDATSLTKLIKGNYSPLCGRLTRVWRVEILQAS